MSDKSLALKNYSRGELSSWSRNDNFDCNKMNLKQQSVLSNILRNISGHSIFN